MARFFARLVDSNCCYIGGFKQIAQSGRKSGQLDDDEAARVNPGALRSFGRYRRRRLPTFLVILALVKLRKRQLCCHSRIIGSVPIRLVATILSLMPGCELDAWMSDYAMPERAVAPKEQIWSNIMDPVAAAKFLDQQS